MRRATVITLVLMGGGAALIAARPSAECRDARARHDPNANAICHTSGSSGGHASGGASSSGRSGTESASIERGGFGGFGLHSAAS
jgi:hypothetical protein